MEARVAGAATLGAPRPASGGAATRLAPSGAAGEEVSVCEPAAAQAPCPAGGDLAAPGSQVAERRQGFGVHTLLSACVLCPGEKRGTGTGTGVAVPRAREPRSSSALSAPGS